MKQPAHRGYTLIEIIVVIGIIGIFSAVVYANFSTSSAQSRDAQRQADLRNLQSAIELYKNRNGRYPAGCNGPTNWSGQVGTNFACPGGSGQYIAGLAPEFISVLPADPRAVSGDRGYAYTTNTNGTVFKLVAMNTVEADVINYDHPFKSCDIKPAPNDVTRPSGSQDIVIGGWCNNLAANSSGPPPRCLQSNDNGQTETRFNATYGVWGGFATTLTAPLTTIVGETNRRNAVGQTTSIICK